MSPQEPISDDDFIHISDEDFLEGYSNYLDEFIEENSTLCEYLRNAFGVIYQNALKK